MDTIDSSRFSNPDAFYWPGYIWFWNGRITRKDLRAQLKDMAEHGAMSVWPLPAPRSFRPTFMPTSLEPDYLTAGFLDHYRYMVEQAQRLGMNVWLYDDGGWPSGMACGRIVRKKPSLAQQNLDRRVLEPEKGEVVVIPENCLAAFAFEAGKSRRRLAPGTVHEIAKTPTRIEVYFVQRIDAALACRNETVNAATFYPDLLNPDATREFIRMTHEAFKTVIGEHFGQTVPLVFTDEVKVSNRPWTDGLAEDFRRTYGYDLLEKLPDVFKGDEAEGMRTRVDYFDWWSRRFAETFFAPVAKWCRKNGLLFAGHLGGDGDAGTVGARIYGFGHPLRTLRELDIPGIDAIWRQIFPGRPTVKVFPGGSKVQVNANHFYTKYASTVAHQEDRPWVITESFAVYGAGLTPAQTKWITDFQYVRGANLMTIGGYQLSNRDHFMGGQRPVQGPFNSLWKHMDLYHGYVARMSYLLSRGRPLVETAVYYPVRDLWAGGPEVGAVIESHDTLAQRLLECQCDFDLIDDDVLERGSTKVGGGFLQVGPMRYRTIFVCRTRWMTEQSQRALRRFSEKGGRVFWVDSEVKSRKGAGGLAIERADIAKYATPLIEVENGNTMIRVCARDLADGRLYFVTNEALGRTACTIRFRETQPMVILDPETGSCHQPAEADFADGVWALRLKMEFAGSCVVLFSEDARSAEIREPLRTRVLRRLDRGWTCRKRRAYRLGVHDFEVDERFGDRAVSIRLGDWRSKLGKGFSGDAEYAVRFDCDAEMVGRAERLDLGRVRYACEVIINGESVGRRVWAPYVFAISDRLRVGPNEIRVIVTNTMANEFATTKVLDQWPSQIIGPYHGIAKLFEAESLPSGLFGPVSILGSR